MISREIGWSNLNNLTYGVSQQVNKIQKQVCCNCNISTTTTTTTVFRNFDVTADWSLSVPAVTSPATFKTFLESGQDGDGNTNNLTGVVVTDFLLVGNRLRCNVSSTGGGDLGFAYMGVTDFTSFGNLQMNSWLYLYSNNISSVDNTSWPIGVEDGIDIGNNSITSFDNVTWPSSLNGYLGLYDNAIISFNPVTPLPNTITDLDLSNTFITSVDNIVWPSDLQDLYLNDNQIITFDPNNALPSGLLYIGLSGNQIINFDPTIALPNSLEELGLNNNQIITFDPSLALPSSLIYLSLQDNQIVTFDPSIALPSGLQQLYLNDNQIVTFNPLIPLPDLSFSTLYLYNNQMTTAGYTGSEPWANAMSVIPGRGYIDISSNINSVSGTNLETILIAKGWIVNV